MATVKPAVKKARNRASSFKINTESSQDPAAGHHPAGSLWPETPIGSNTPERTHSPAPFQRKTAPDFPIWSRWATDLSTSLTIVLLPVVLYVNWEVVAPILGQQDLTNPFGYAFRIQNPVPTSSPEDPRYAKSWWDLLFLAYYIVFFSFVRQFVTEKISNPMAKYFGLKKEAKLVRFGEQTYAILYFGIFGIWGLFIMHDLPTWYYRTEYFWIDYPHWQMQPLLKRYYLMQIAYWLQQLLVLVLGLEKPRKDYWEFVAHHIVTLWLVGWSYFMNLTLIGNAVYPSMDIPDTALAISKLLNYIQFERAKVVAFGIFFVIWTYFRHYMSLKILWSVWFEFDLVPEAAKQWNMKEGVYMVYWLKYQIFFALAALQVLNLFWYYLMWRILFRAIITSKTADERSDDEDEGEEEPESIEHEKQD